MGQAKKCQRMLASPEAGEKQGTDPAPASAGSARTLVLDYGLEENEFLLF